MVPVEGMCYKCQFNQEFEPTLSRLLHCCRWRRLWGVFLLMVVEGLRSGYFISGTWIHILISSVFNGIVLSLCALDDFVWRCCERGPVGRLR